MLITQITSPLQHAIMLWDLKLETFLSCMNFIHAWISFDEFHSFASELNRAADVIVFSETWFSANTCHAVQGYKGFHTYRADKTGGGGSVFIRNCYIHQPIWPNFHCVMHIMWWVWWRFRSQTIVPNYYRCLQTTRQIKDSRVYNKIKWNFVINFTIWPCIHSWRP